MVDHILTLNAGSSSVKFALFAVEAGRPQRLAAGQVAGVGVSAVFHARLHGEKQPEAPIDARTHDDAVSAILKWIAGCCPGKRIDAFGHRVVHGGVEFSAPVVIDDVILQKLRQFEPLAPLHQPHNLRGVAAARKAFPGVPQIACFDTSFHRDHSFVNDAYALPRLFYERGLRRFGFHGLSYEFISRRLREIDPECARGRVIVAHLGNGSSLCAMQGGASIATTMGFTALEGLPMGTRSGAIDPGVLLYLMDELHMDARAIEDLLYRRSGLLGVSGISPDMRVLLDSPDPRAAQAIDLYVYRIGREIGSMAAALGGLDALVFTAGIGEHAAPVRARVCRDAAWLGVTLDERANAAHGPRISATGSRASAWVIPTDEELMIARHIREVLGA